MLEAMKKELFEKLMVETMKTEIFERLGKERAKLFKNIRTLKNLGHAELAEQTLSQSFGLDTAVEALGFTVVEFHQYYRENRSRFNQDGEE